MLLLLLLPLSLLLLPLLVLLLLLCSVSVLWCLVLHMATLRVATLPNPFAFFFSRTNLAWEEEEP